MDTEQSINITALLLDDVLEQWFVLYFAMALSVHWESLLDLHHNSRITTKILKDGLIELKVKTN